jgi:plasmid stabilization system protein ParE
MKVFFSPTAKVEIEKIADFISLENPVAAEDVVRDPRSAAQSLKEFPYRGRAQSDLGVRQLVSRQYRYLIYYRIVEAAGEIETVTVQHGLQSRSFQDS